MSTFGARCAVRRRRDMPPTCSRQRPRWQKQCCRHRPRWEYRGWSATQTTARRKTAKADENDERKDADLLVGAHAVAVEPGRVREEVRRHKSTPRDEQDDDAHHHKNAKTGK